MTVNFCYEMQSIIPCITLDTVPIDFKLDNFMLRGAMRIFKFSRRLSRSICSNFFIIRFEKNYAKTFWRRVDQVFLKHCMPSC